MTDPILGSTNLYEIEYSPLMETHTIPVATGELRKREITNENVSVSGNNFHNVVDCYCRYVFVPCFTITSYFALAGCCILAADPGSKVIVAAFCIFGGCCGACMIGAIEGR